MNAFKQFLSEIDLLKTNGLDKTSESNTKGELESHNIDKESNKANSQDHNKKTPLEEAYKEGPKDDTAGPSAVTERVEQTGEAMTKEVEKTGEVITEEVKRPGKR